MAAIQHAAKVDVGLWETIDGVLGRAPRTICEVLDIVPGKHYWDKLYTSWPPDQVIYRVHGRQTQCSTTAFLRTCVPYRGEP